jgi:hypothetical protein
MERGFRGEVKITLSDLSETGSKGAEYIKIPF